MANKNFVGTIECVDGWGKGLKNRAILKADHRGDVVSAIPFTTFDRLQGKGIQFGLPIKANQFKVLSVEGDTIDDLIDIVEI